MNTNPSTARLPAARLLGFTALAFALGAGTGWLVRGEGDTASSANAPEHWVARIGGQFVSREAFIDEMKLHGGERPGPVQNLEQKRALLDELVYRAALMQVAEQTGMTKAPDVQRAIGQVVTSRYLQDTLRRAQQDIAVTDAEVAAYHAKHATDYMIPARKRAAMVKIAVAANADEAQWVKAEQRATQALAKAKKQAPAVRHFGEVAREYSDDAASRYRGGVIGWIAELRQDRYQHDKAVLDALNQLTQGGDFAGPVRGSDGVYLVRLVENQPRRERGLAELAPGIKQHLMQERVAASEKEFRSRLMREVNVKVDEAALVQIKPLGPPASPEPQQPPAMPRDQG